MKNGELENIDPTVLAAYSEKFQKLTRWDTYMECIFGCGTGGALYLLLVASVVLWFDSTLVAIFFAWPFLIILGFLAGAIFGTLASMIVLPINASLCGPLKSLWFSFIVGGLSGFLPFFLLLITLAEPQEFAWTFLFVAMPLPHMVLGHLWAYWMTEKAVNDHNQRLGVARHDASQTSIRSSRFGISQMMILTIWVAIGCALFSCLTPEFRLLLVGLYLTLQFSAGLVAIIVIGLVSRVRRYRNRRVSAADH